MRVGKSRYNSFGKFKYRSCDDILTAIKPLLLKYGLSMTIMDEVIAVGERIYVKATVSLVDPDGGMEISTAFAREPETKKGMDDSQLTGTASSYARKYALSGLFLLDDTQDADTDAYHIQTSESEKPTYTRAYLTKHGKDPINTDQIEKLTAACAAAGGNMTLDNAIAACNKSSVNEITVTQYVSLMSRLGAAA